MSLLLFVLSVPLHAQRTNFLGAAIDMAGGVSNNPPLILPQPGTTGGEASLFLGLFPMISLDSRSGSSSINATFAYGLNRFQTSDPVVNHTQSASADLSEKNLSAMEHGRFRIVFTEYRRQYFLCIAGSGTGRDDPSVLADRGQCDSITNQAHVGLDNQFSQKSTLSFSLDTP